MSTILNRGISEHFWNISKFQYALTGNKNINSPSGSEMAAVAHPRLLVG